MSDELFISGKNFISSKKAAIITGYAQDYIGQLARGGLIEAQRVGGLWYVYLDSLTGYKTKAAEFKPQPPTVVPSQDPESIVSFDGLDYVSASRAAKITGYNQDYIGQLARSGKILSRQIGNRWYVERTGLVGHKSEKDSLLAAVQSESVGLRRATSPIEAHRGISTGPVTHAGEYAGSGPVLSYFKDERDLMPVMDTSKTLNFVPVKNMSMKIDNRIPVRISPQKKPVVLNQKASKQDLRTSEPSMSIAVKSMAALTIVIVLSYGLVSLKERSTYATNATPGAGVVNQNQYLAAASEAVGRLGDMLETMVSRELIYTRAPSQ